MNMVCYPLMVDWLMVFVKPDKFTYTGTINR